MLIGQSIILSFKLFLFYDENLWKDMKISMIIYQLLLNIKINPQFIFLKNIFAKLAFFLIFQALLCILAENCDEAAYKKLVQALCQEHQIPLLTVPDNMQLGKYAGLCKLDAEGNERKVVRCSSVVVRDWGKEGPALDFLKDHIKQQRA